MSQRNRPYVDEIINEAEDGLQDYVLKQYKQRYSAKEYLCELSYVLEISPPLESEEQAKVDIQSPGWLNAIWHRKDLFSNKLGMNRNVKDFRARDGLNFVGELLNARNRYSHRNQPNSFTDDDVHSLADTATRLLRVIKKNADADRAEEIRQEFGKRLYISEESPAESYEPERESASPPEEPIVQIVREPHPRVDLRGAKLRKMDLRNRELRFAILSGAKLEESNLRGEDLSEVRLDYASLKGADLSMAKLAGANLSKADLNDATLSHAILRRTKLPHTKLRHANMEFADLQHANLTHADLDSAHLRNADLSYANLTSANLVGTDFRGANLQGAELKGAKLKWDGRDFLRKSPIEAMFDKTSVLPDGKAWRRSTNLTKFTRSPENG